VSVVSLVSAKGTPGVTTTAVALTAVEQVGAGSAVWVELDPSGGTGWLRSQAAGRRVEPRLGELFRLVREGRAGMEWTRLAVAAPPAVPAILAPQDRRAASRLVVDGAARWCGALAISEGLVFLDCGRWDPVQPGAGRISGSDVVGLVCRSTLESVDHARHLVQDLREIARCPLAVVVVGSHPYRGPDIADALSIPLGGVIEWRRRDVAALWARGATQLYARSTLGRSARRAVDGLLAVRIEAPGGPSRPDARSFEVTQFGSRPGRRR
jgi:hypothetical protein